MTAAITFHPHRATRRGPMQPVTAPPVVSRHVATHPVARRHPEATYRRRRAVVGVIAAAIVASTTVLAHDVLAGSSGVPASAASSQPAHHRSSVTARPGDTLWSIAERHHGEIALTRYVDALVNLNGGPSIQAGQAVVLP